MNLLKNVDWNELFKNVGNKLFYIAITSILFYILYKFCKKIVERFFKNYSQKSWSNTNWTLTFSRIAQSALQYITLFLYIYTVLDIVGIPMSKLLAGAGFFGVGLTLVGKDLLSDITNGFFIIFENQASVGDYVSVVNMPAAIGLVKSVGIRSLVLIDGNGSIIYVPNHNIQSIRNFSKETYKLYIDLPLANSSIENPDTISKEITKVNKNIFSQNKDLFIEEPTYIGIHDINNSGLFIRNLAKVKYTDRGKAEALLMEGYLELNLKSEKEQSKSEN
ncbi:hypothetical protein BG262_08755 [Floricoccus penangensis]|uniref:Mechanosensitive ion channel protein MscS n=1 Tax=Floricoccus penangensis TaxID=1859475 RepID=A0A9Q5P0H5_9LACT|nr:mechanosensitive ion channel domain-containing protein [Floricoccus penangensis]OFI47771.1 hypothetical protein BG262_08755 [Floricoccus penangensis]